MTDCVILRMRGVYFTVDGAMKKIDSLLKVKTNDCGETYIKHSLLGKKESEIIINATTDKKHILSAVVTDVYRRLKARRRKDGTPDFLLALEEIMYSDVVL